MSMILEFVFIIQGSRMRCDLSITGKRGKVSSVLITNESHFLSSLRNNSKQMCTCYSCCIKCGYHVFYVWLKIHHVGFIPITWTISSWFQTVWLCLGPRTSVVQGWSRMMIFLRCYKKKGTTYALFGLVSTLETGINYKTHINYKTQACIRQPLLILFDIPKLWNWWSVGFRWFQLVGIEWFIHILTRKWNILPGKL